MQAGSLFGLPIGRRLLGIVLAAAIVAIAAMIWAQPFSGSGSPAKAQSLSGRGLTAFRSTAELRNYLRRIRREQEQLEQEVPPPVYVPMPSPPSESAADSSAPSAPAPLGAEESITNTQEAGVDEGGIVKVRGDHLVILRRGRVFTVSIAGGDMRPVDSIDASPPGVDAQGSWYDEMLLSGDRIIVVGFSYARGGTEVTRFRIGADGMLRFEDAYNLRSNDYYSSRNYASRLIGNRLIFYTPLNLDWERDPLEALPGLRRWQDKPEAQAFKPITTARQVYIPPVLRTARNVAIDTLHSVTTCDLTTPELDCSAVAVLGPASRNFYVSGQAVYLWMSDAWSGSSRQPRGAQGFLYRLPLARERPSAIAVRGAPIDQFSFREDFADRTLNVLLRADGGGDAMWTPEVSAGDVALLRLPLGEMGDGSREAPLSRYRSLPSPDGASYNFHNRFVGDYVLYGAWLFGDASELRATAFAVPVRGGEATRLTVRHAVERIEVLGRDAMIVGGIRGALGFTAVDLGQGGPKLGDSYVHPAASEGETRNHAYFFRADPGSPDGASGILGLPVARRADPAYRRFFGSSAAMVFLRREDRRLRLAGELVAQQQGVTDDGCKASCVDWYGNARPIFLGGRTFALMGYELVEGTLAEQRVREIGRVNFAPRPKAVRDGG